MTSFKEPGSGNFVPVSFGRVKTSGSGGGGEKSSGMMSLRLLSPVVKPPPPPVRIEN
jgi:hypothetical protein